MKFPLPLDVFPRVQFAKQDQSVLHSVTKALVDDTLQRYHAQRQFQVMTAMATAARSSSPRGTLQVQHLRNGVPDDQLEDQCSVDSQRWRLLKRRDNIRVYKERSSFHQAQRERQQQQAHPNAGNTVSESAGFSDLELASKPHNQQQAVLPMMMGIGSVLTNVDDVVYGLLNHTQEVAQIRASYVEDDVVDSQVLASLTRPSGSEPLRSLSVKWCAKRHNGIIRSLVRYRDFVFIEATGSTRDQNGERIAYYLIHSIAVPGVRELHEMNVVRAEISMCCLFRQKHDSTVEVFMRGFLNPLGDVPLSTAMASAAESVLSIWKTIRCAQMKKLAWELATAAASESQRREARNVDSCEICWEGLRASLHSAKRCQVCRRHLCSRCRVPKKLNFLSPESPAHAVQKSVLFCSCCVLKSTQTSSIELAVRESAAQDAIAAYDAHTVTTMSPSSAAPSSTRSRAPHSSPKSTRSCASSASSNYYPPSSGYSSAASTPSARAAGSRRGSRMSRWFQ